uniref:Hypotheticial protein n=1 Tax=Schistosoma japonicum TaxID=6182 RepID=C7TXS3_SCHJA|nr:hypotheticial protein [Schistosoma japonicum]
MNGNRTIAGQGPYQQSAGNDTCSDALTFFDVVTDVEAAIQKILNIVTMIINYFS